MRGSPKERIAVQQRVQEASHVRVDNTLYVESEEKMAARLLEKRKNVSVDTDAITAHQPI